MNRARDTWTRLRPHLFKETYPRSKFTAFPTPVFVYWLIWFLASLTGCVLVYRGSSDESIAVLPVCLFVVLVAIADKLELRIPLIQEQEKLGADAFADWNNRDLFIQMSLVLLSPRGALIVVASGAALTLYQQRDWIRAIGFSSLCLVGGLVSLATLHILAALGATSLESPLWIPVMLVAVYVAWAAVEAVQISGAMVMRSFDLRAFPRSMRGIFDFYRTDAIVMQTTTQVSVMVAGALAYSGVAAWWAPALALVPCAVAWRASKQARQLKEATTAMFTDPLTALLNRRGFSERAGQEIELARQYRHPVYVAMADLDNFKRVNDTYGHDAGDGALLAIADVLTQQLRGQRDVPARFGGEEFVVLLPAVSCDEAMAVLDGIRREAESRLESLGSSISIGVTSLRVDESIDEALGRADEALYAAKMAGKNRVLLAAGEPLGTTARAAA